MGRVCCTLMHKSLDFCSQQKAQVVLEMQAFAGSRSALLSNDRGSPAQMPLYGLVRQQRFVEMSH